LAGHGTTMVIGFSGNAAFAWCNGKTTAKLTASIAKNSTLPIFLCISFSSFLNGF
jgi:hypothetical protein